MCIMVQWCRGADLENGAGNNAAALPSLAALHGVRLARTCLPVAEQAHLQLPSARWAITQTLIQSTICDVNMDEQRQCFAALH